MVKRLSKEEVKDKLHRALYQVVMEEGIEGVTVRKISRASGLSDPYIYQCYKNLKDMMAAAFMETEQELEELAKQLLSQEESCEDSKSRMAELWRKTGKAYWELLMRDPEKTVFYWRYCQSANYNRELLEKRRNVLRKIAGYLEIPEEKIDNAIIYNIADEVMSVAVKIHLGYIREEDVKMQSLCFLLSEFISYTLKE